MNKIIIGTVIAIIIVVAILGVLYTVGSSKEAHHKYCQNWSNNIDRQKQDISNQIFSDQLNNEISNYNRECAY